MFNFHLIEVYLISTNMCQKSESSVNFLVLFRRPTSMPSEIAMLYLCFRKVQSVASLYIYFGNFSCIAAHLLSPS